MVAKRWTLFFVSVTGLVVLLDQLVKWLLLFFMSDFSLGLLRIHFVRNTGAGFGILQGWTWLLALISLLVVIAVIFYYKRVEKKMVPQLLVALFLGGAVGNLFDRAFRGFVIDFIDFGFWPAFNIADAAITVGAIGLIVWYWKKERKTL